MNEPPIGLPIKPGQPIPEQVAEGLVDPQALKNMQPVTKKQLEDDLKKMRENAADLKQAPAAAPTQAEPPAPAAPADHNPKYCPRCNWDQGLKYEVQISDEDKRAFCRFVLTGGRFIKTYTIFDGLVRITFRSRTMVESEDVSSHVHWKARSGQLDVHMLFVEGNKMSLAYSIAKVETLGDDGQYKELATYPDVTDESYPVNTPKTPAGTVPPDAPRVCKRAHDSIFATRSVSEMHYNAIYNEFMKFDRLQEVLTIRGSEPGFLRATQSAS
jgi:hypothetical protein